MFETEEKSDFASLLWIHAAYAGLLEKCFNEFLHA